MRLIQERFATGGVQRAALELKGVNRSWGQKCRIAFFGGYEKPLRFHVQPDGFGHFRGEHLRQVVQSKVCVLTIALVRVKVWGQVPYVVEQRRSHKLWARLFANSEGGSLQHVFSDGDALAIEFLRLGCGEPRNYSLKGGQRSSLSFATAPTGSGPTGWTPR